MVFIHVIRIRPSGLVQFPAGKLLRSVLHLFHQAFVQCVQTGTGALTGLWLRDGVAWLTLWVDRTVQTQMGHIMQHDLLLRDITEGRMLGKATRG